MSSMDEQTRIAAEILRNKFVAVMDDMRATLVNTAYSAAISESKECANALFLENGALVATDNPVHMCSLVETTASILDYFEFDLTGEDIIITNDPYGGGTRIQDFTLVAPVTHEGEIVLYLAVRARMPDVGGEILGGFNPSATEIWAEGARFTPTKLYRDGKLQKDILTTILLNGRAPDAFRLDLEAMLAALNIGRQRMDELIQRYGLESVLRAMAWAIEYANRRFEAELAAWPQGTFDGESVLAHDSHGAEALPIRVKLRVQEGRIEIDLAPTEARATSFVNSTRATTFGYALLPILSALDESIPRNSGILQRVELKTTKGTVVDADFPVPTAWSLCHVGSEVSDAVADALAKLQPQKAANTTANMMLVNVLERTVRHGGTIEQTQLWSYDLFCQGGCSGASVRDGWGMPGVFAERPLPSIELYEAQWGAEIVKLEYVTDSAGPGRWRGGPGTETVIRLPRGAENLHLTVAVEGSSGRTTGFAGGENGSANQVRVRAADQERSVEQRLIDEQVPAGTQLCLRMGGGAGWGSPWERDPQLVLEDVLGGYVSVEAAAEQYGVVIDGDSLTLDAQATDKKRAGRRRGSKASSR